MAILEVVTPVKALTWGTPLSLAKIWPSSDEFLGLGYHIHNGTNLTLTLTLTVSLTLTVTLSGNPNPTTRYRCEYDTLN